MESTQSKIQIPKSKIWLLAARPKTLGAAIAPVLMGTAMAWAAGGFHALAAWCALLGAVLIQIGTNFSNDYSDFHWAADNGDDDDVVRVFDEDGGVFLAEGGEPGEEETLIWDGGELPENEMAPGLVRWDRIVSFTETSL
jgi:hypothetical protein